MASLSAKIFDAVCAESCPLSADARHFVLVLAWAADGKTGVGFKNQNTLAAMLGKSARQVRRLFQEVNDTPDSPVTVNRTPRFRSDGRGRTSDVYQIHLTNRTPTSTCSKGSTGHPRPPEGQDQADTSVHMNNTTNRTPTVVQPDIHGPTNRTPTSRDRSSRGSSKRSSLSVSRRWTRVPQSWEPNDAHQEKAKQLGVDFETELALFRDHEFAKPKKDADAAFRTWLTNAKKFQAGARRGPQPQRGLASRVKTGTWEDL